MKDAAINEASGSQSSVAAMDAPERPGSVGHVEHGAALACTYAKF